MKLSKLNFPIWGSLFAAALLLGLPFLCSEANAFRGGGGGFSGGSFRGGGVAAVGPRGNVAAVGPQGRVAVGTVVRTLPDFVETRVVAGQRYYYDGDVYYQECYQGTDVIYCVVPAPPQ